MSAVLPSQATLDGLLALTGKVAGAQLLDHLTSDLAAVDDGLAHCLAVEDWPRLRSESHVLIGVAGAVGADPLMELARGLNAAAHAQDSAVLTQSGEECRRLLRRLIGHIRSLQGCSGQDPAR